MLNRQECHTQQLDSGLKQMVDGKFYEAAETIDCEECGSYFEYEEVVETETGFICKWCNKEGEENGTL